MALKKSDLIKILVEEYGYEKEDLKFDAEGKPYTNGKLQQIIKAEEEDAKQVEVDATRKVAVKSKIKDEDRIVIMAGIDAVGYYSERSNRSWKFEKFGQEDTIEYRELVAMRNKYPSYFTDGLIIVLDKVVQEEFKLTELYKNILTPDNIEDVFNMDIEELDKFVDALPDSQKVTLVQKAIEKFEKKQLTNYAMIVYFQEKFNFGFEDNSPLNDVVQSVDTGVHNIIYVDNKRL